ncbi:MAG TPA: glycosyltransferase family 2 protein, partial [Ktedonobacteraceae bacterium]
SAGNGLSYQAEQSSISIVLPAYNEEEVIIATVENVLRTLDAWHIDYEVIVVNDGSADRTGILLAELAARTPRLRVITHVTNKGYGAALISGFEAASKELSFFMDSDGQFSIEELHQFLPFATSYDAVIGYRLQRQDRWIRTLNAWGWKQVVALVLGVRVRDIDCAFKLYHTDFLHRQVFETRGAMINAEMLYKLQRESGRMKQIGVHHLPRQGGKATGANIKVILRAFKELLVYSRQWRDQVPQRLPERVIQH